MATNLDEIQIKISQDSSDAAKSIDSLIDSLGKLAKATDLSKTAENIKSLSGSVDSLSSASKKLEKIDISGAMKGIASNTFGALKSLAGWGVSLTVIGKQLANSIGLASNYVNTIKMLNITMGEGADEAKEFAEELGNVLGLNPADTMNFQATFQNLFMGFGNNAKQAQIMSKNLTQLSYDMASFYGELVGSDPQAAAEKLRLGMAGTIEPIQRLGYAIKEADLQAVAARQGLNVNIRNLNTASKSMLRYIAIMEQSKHVQGDMARSFMTPATAMIIYKSAVKQLSTEIGETFIPMLMTVIPYMQAFVRGILNMVKTVNDILGIKLPEMGTDEQRQGIASLGDEATEAGNKMKKAFTLGIDELNVLDSTTANAGSGMQDITDQLKLPEYNMLEGFSGDKLKEIEDRLKPLQPLFDGLAMAFAGFYEAVSWLGEDVFYPWLVSIGEWMQENPDTMWLIGQGLGYIGAGLLILKTLGALGSILGLPNLFVSLKNGIVGVYKDSDKKLIPTLGTLGLKLLAVALLGLSLYSALQLVKTVIDIKNGDIEGWEGFRQVVGWTMAAVGLFGLALAALGLPISIVAAGAIAAFGLIAAKWYDFAFGVQISAAYLGQFLKGTFEAIGAAVMTVIVGISFGIVEAIYGIIWKVLRDIESFTNTVLKSVKSVAEMADKILGTSFASKVTTEVDLTGGLEKRMSDTLNSFTNSMKDIWGKVGDTFTADVWEGEYLQNATAIYQQGKARENKNDDGAIETIAGEFKKLFSDYQNSNENLQQEMDNLNQNQIQLTEQNTEQLETQKVANDLATASNILQTDYNTTSLANDEEMAKTLATANNLQTSTTNDVVSTIKNIGSDIISALRRVEDACRNIKIEVHKHYGGGDGYASGGFPTSGEMFFAREDGLPEMVGRVGRQTAVMNNGQIADTMAQSLIRAMGQSGGNSQPQVIENKLYLDGEVVYTNQQKIQRSKGYNLGMGVFANV